jgi:Mycothiol maleylpyruvate isomerase N-terminal domain
MNEIDVVATAEALRRTSVRVANLLRAVANPGRRAGRLDWTISETAAHLVGGVEHYTSYLCGEGAGPPHPSPGPARNAAEQTALGNARLLAEFAERDPVRLAEQLGPAVENFLAAVTDCDAVTPRPTDTGIVMTAPTIAATALGELLVHGLDIAQGVGVRWRVGRADSLLVLAGVIPLLANYLDRDRATTLRIAYEIRLRGGGRYRLAIQDGQASVSAAGEPVDCLICADPADFLLVGYQRAGQWGRVLRGGLLSGGPKPWLGLRFGSLLTTI